jgi:hypothetical protein
MTDVKLVDAKLKAAVAEIDVIDLAGRIIANPRRTQVSQAGELALAMAVERFWEIAIEAELLVRALDMQAGDYPEVREAAIEHQAATVKTMMAALRGATEEKNDAGR